MVRIAGVAIVVLALHVTWVSAAHTPPSPPKAPKQIDHVVGRMSGNKWTGTVVSVLASKPDSVLAKVKWEGTKTQ